MATHQAEENGNAKRRYTDSDDEEEELQDENWDDWNDGGDAEEEDCSNPQMLCLFCDSSYSSCSSLFEHCASAHTFDFNEIKKAYNLDFYKCLKLINYVRSQVAVNKCWSCGMACSSKAELQKHLHKAVSFDGNRFPWDDDRYLNPFLQDDSLLYSFGEDDVDEECDNTYADINETESYLSQFERIDINESASEPVVPCDNGGRDIKSSSSEDTKSLMVDDANNAAGGILSNVNGKNKTNSYPSTKIGAKEMTNINKSYFGSYSSFGIHKEMISDKVRTDAYRQALLENPSLLKNAVVMDVGCGTGILSLFAAQAGASRVIAVEASEKMAAVATQIAGDNNLLSSGTSSEGSKRNGSIEVVQGMVEELDSAENTIPSQSVDVLVSEWMGYCLLYESMLASVLFARDKWLKPGGAILPDTATMYLAGFGREATSLPFWENVYGFDMSRIGREVAEDSAGIPIVDVIDSSHIVTNTKVLQTFDLVTMQSNHMDFTAIVELEPTLVSQSNNSLDSKSLAWCYGVVLWFDTTFSERFCHEKPVILSTSPYGPSTHWSQTILTFREPIAMASSFVGEKVGPVGTDECPAARIQARVSVVRSVKHRSIDISMELSGIDPGGRKRNWPAQIFHIN